jgi:hypothetical protein
VRDANSQVAHLVKIGEDGRLKLYRWQYGYDQLISVSVASAPARGWHYIELQVTQGTSNGVLSVRINGILAIQMNAQNTIQGGGQLLTAFVGACPASPARSPSTSTTSTSPTPAARSTTPSSATCASMPCRHRPMAA